MRCLPCRVPDVQLWGMPAEMELGQRRGALTMIQAEPFNAEPPGMTQAPRRRTITTGLAHDRRRNASRN